MIHQADPAPLQITNIKIANYAARSGELVQCDASGGSFTVTLPGSPRVNQVVGVKLLETTGGNSVTIVRNGNMIEGEAGDLVLKAAADYRELQYDGAGQWLALSELGTPSATVLFHPPNGRLTLTSGEPVPSSDVTGASTIFYTPYNGNSIWLYSGSAWTPYSFAEISLPLSGLTAGKNYDIFCYWTGSSPALWLSSAWANNSTPTDTLTKQDGVDVLASDHTKLHVGLFRATGASTTDMAVGPGVGPRHSFLWNRYHPALVYVGAADNGVGYTYTTQAWRRARNTDVTLIDWVQRAGGNSPLLKAKHQSSNGSLVFRQAGVMVNGGTPFAGSTAAIGTVSEGFMTGLTGGPTTVGYQYAYCGEWSVASGTTTWISGSLDAYLWC